MKRPFDIAGAQDPEVTQEAQTVSDNAGFAYEAECTVQALAYCLEMLYRGKDRLPEEVEASVSPQLRDLAQDITDEVTTVHNPSKDELHRFHLFNDTHPNIAWPYALVEAIMYDIELPSDTEGCDAVWRSYNYMGQVDPADVGDLPLPIRSMQNFFADTVMEELDDFIRTASRVIGQHFETGPIIPALVFVAMERASDHYEGLGLHLTEIDIETWFPNFYEELLENTGSKEALEIFDIQIH